MRFFCLFIPHFAAWALAQANPQLQKIPFAVCERGLVIALSPLAVEAGLTLGMTSGRAQSRLSNLLITGRDLNLEAQAWAEVQRTFYGMTPKLEAVHKGLLFADVDHKAVLPLLRVWKAQGGEASDRATAHLAALSAPRGHTRLIKPNNTRAFTGITPLDYLAEAGVSSKAIQRLGYFGWYKVGDLANITRRQLEEQIGVDGFILFRFAQGPRFKHNLTPIPRWNPPEEVSAALEFEVAAREPAHWDGALDELLQEVCEGLGTNQAMTLEITAHTPIAPVTSRRVLKEPLSHAGTMRRAAQSALTEALATLLPLPPVVLRLEVTLGGLTTAPVQETLFEDEKATKAKRLASALRQIKKRMPNRIGHYITGEPHSPFVEEHHRWAVATSMELAPHNRQLGAR